MLQYMVCRVLPDPRGTFGSRFISQKKHPYEIRLISLGETFSEEIDSSDGKALTVVKKDGEVMVVLGEFCGIFKTMKEAVALQDKLEQIYEVMES